MLAKNMHNFLGETRLELQLILRIRMIPRRSVDCLKLAQCYKYLNTQEHNETLNAYTKSLTEFRRPLSEVASWS